MRLRNVKNAKEIVSSSRYSIDATNRIDIDALFSNENPVHVEIGMGKGDFLIGMAEKYPDINFIGVERYESVLVRAVEKLEDKNLSNLRVVAMDALNIDGVLPKEVSVIYLNFSDPWPKKRHAKRRLTSEVFLKKYDAIFKSDAHIIMKTDNIGLFASSLENLSQYGYKFYKVSHDLAAADIDNVLTEYEKKFMSLGVKINYLDAVKNREK